MTPRGFPGPTAPPPVPHLRATPAQHPLPPPQPPPRTCRTCGNVERNIHYRCTNCGRDYAADPPRFSRRAKITAAVVAGVLLVVGLAVAIPLLLTTKNEETAEQSAADRLAASRQAAKLRVAEGRLQGPIRETLCSNIERGVRQGEEVDLGVRIGRYDCVASQRDVVKQGKVVAHLGYDYFGALDFATGAYVFCQGTPNQSEAGRALAVALLLRACLNAHGQRLKGGFLSDPRDTRQPLPQLA